jgi:hypothetical protein
MLSRAALRNEERNSNSIGIQQLKKTNPYLSRCGWRKFYIGSDASTGPLGGGFVLPPAIRGMIWFSGTAPHIAKPEKRVAAPPVAARK